MEDIKCPRCESETIKQGKIGAPLGQVHMYAETGRSKSSPVSAIYCNDCGYVIFFYGDKPKIIG